MADTTMINSDTLWQAICAEATEFAAHEPVLASFFHNTILNHSSVAEAVSFHLASLMDSPQVPAILLREVFQQAMADDPAIVRQLCRDIVAYRERDAACHHYLMPLLYFKGFHALQAHRVAHWLWRHDRKPLALYLQNQVSRHFGVDIHPAARIGAGIMIDHATGVVIGETAVVEDDVSMLHGVTLGGSGKLCGTDRHPKIRRGVLLSTGAKVLGCVEVGEGAKVGAGSLVLDDVPAHTTVAGVPARVIGKPREASPAEAMDHRINDN